MLKKIAFNKYVNTTIWYAIESIVRLAGGLFVGVLLARYLGPEDFGHFTYIYTIFILLNVIVKFGLDANIIKELKSVNNSRESVISSAMIIRFFLALFINTIILILYSVYQIENNILIISITLFFLVSEVFEPYYISKNSGKTLSIIKIVALIFSLMAKLTIIYFDLGLKFLIYNIFIENMTLAVLYWISIKKINLEVNLSTIYKLLIQSIPLLLSNFLIIAFIKIDQLMINFLMSERDLGIYTVGIKITETAFIASTIFSTAIFPYLINISSSKKLLNEKCFKFISLFAWFGVSIAILIFLFSEILISMFGENYTKSVEILKITCWVIPMVYIGGVFNKLILVKNYGYIILRKSLFALLINIVLNYFLIKIYGLDGAAYALVISYAYMHIIHDFFEKKIRNSAIEKITCLFMLVKSFKGLKNEIISIK